MLELTITIRRNGREVELTSDQLRKLLCMADDMLECQKGEGHGTQKK